MTSSIFNPLSAKANGTFPQITKQRLPVCVQYTIWKPLSSLFYEMTTAAMKEAVILREIL